MSNPSRERILGRITNALQQKLPPLAVERRPIFAPIADLVERFQAECKANLTELIFTRNGHETCHALNEVLASIEPGIVFADDSAEIRAMLGGHKGAITWSTQGRAPEASVATVTRVEALIASTGSLLVSAASGGRGGSIVAPVHIALATRDQLVPDIEAALQLAEERGLPRTSSYFGLITGCSRTADIEKLLVIGAHGPKRLVVIVEG